MVIGDGFLLTPAESMVILNPDGRDGKEMFKLTAIDLLMKKVLETKQVKKRVGIIKKKEVMKVCFQLGEKNKRDFLNLKPHEKVLLVDDLFSKPLEVKEYLRFIYKKVLKGSFLNFEKIVLDGLCKAGYIRKKKERVLWVIPVSRYELTSDGMMIKEKIEGILREGKENLREWTKSEPSRAKSFLLFCGAHVLLIDGYDMETFKNLVRSLSDVRPLEEFYRYYLRYFYEESDEFELYDEDFEFEVDFDDTFDDFDMLDDLDDLDDVNGDDGEDDD